MQPRNGFSLLEVIVAVAVLGLALVSLIGLHNQNLAVIARDQNISIASMLAQGLMAETEAEGYAEPGVENGDFKESWEESFSNFAWEREISELPLPGLRQVRVKVFWDDDPERAVELYYYLPKGR